MAKFNRKVHYVMALFSHPRFFPGKNDIAGDKPDYLRGKRKTKKNEPGCMRIQLSNAPCIRLIVLLVLLFSSHHGANCETTDSVVILENYKMPEYKKNSGKLQFILYGKKAETHGVVIKLTDVLVDIVRDDFDDVKKIKNLQSLDKLYDIDSKKQQVIDFWKDKQHSKALVLTPSATYDRVTKTVRGNERVYLRTPELDINGVGFDADYEHHKIHVRSKVKVVIHTHIDSLMKNRKNKIKPNKTEGKIK